MVRQGKRYRADIKDFDRDAALPLTDAIGKLKSFKTTKLRQSVDICMHLGINPKQADQAVRGSLSLPHGIGVSRRVIAFCKSDVVEQAKEAGAIEAGGEELVAKVEGGWLEFDVAVASPDMMRLVSKLGRALGPKGLMPSPKSGSVTPNIVDAVKEFTAGKVEFRNDDGGNIHATIGKIDFEPTQLEENAQAFIDAIEKMKPASTKGQYVKKITVSGTMTPGVQIAQ